MEIATKIKETAASAAASSAAAGLTVCQRCNRVAPWAEMRVDTAIGQP